MVALPEGTKLQEYTIARVLGEGGFGITYLAEDKTLGRQYAIKEYFPQMWATRENISVSANSASGKDYKWGLESFIREAKTLARFKHHSIVHVIRIIEDNGTAYMVLDYEEGDDFGKWLKDLKRPPSQEELDAIAGTLLDALETVHNNGILHRDIAPDNIKIRADGTPVLLDFGAAREAMGQRTGTMTGIVKHGYSPFEQYSSTGKDQGAWSDIYALGATLYKAVTGKAPSEAIDRMAEDDYTPARDTAKGDYRDGFLAAIDHALRRRRKNRPQTLAEWRKELLSGSAVSEQKKVYSTTPRPRATSPAAPDETESTGSAARSMKWAAALTLVALLGAGGYYFGMMRPAELERQRQALADREYRADDEAWEMALRDNTIAGFTAYLASHEQGRHAVEARTRIKTLEREMHEKALADERKRREDTAWAGAERTNSLAGYRRYLEDYPSGRHAEDARRRIAAFEKEAREKALADEKERRDGGDWAEARRRDTLADYESYLKKHPEGRHADEARTRIAALKAPPAPKPGQINLAQRFNWTVATSFPRDFPQLHPSLVRATDRLKQITGGKVETKIFASGELVGAFDVFDTVEAGEKAQIGWSFLYYWKGKEPGLALLPEIPFGFEPEQTHDWRLKPEVERIVDEMTAGLGIYTVPCGATGRSGDLWSTKEIRTANDLKGLKVRFPGLPGDIFARTGSSPVLLPGSQIYENLVSGAIDATNWLNPQLDYHMKFYEVAKYYYYPGYVETGTIIDLFFNLKTWNAMPSELQRAIEQVCRENVEEDLRVARQEDSKRLQAFKEQGTIVQPLPLPVRRMLLQAWREEAKSISSASSYFARLYATLDEYDGGTIAMQVR